MLHSLLRETNCEKHLEMGLSSDCCAVEKYPHSKLIVMQGFKLIEIS